VPARVKADLRDGMYLWRTSFFGVVLVAVSACVPDPTPIDSAANAAQKDRSAAELFQAHCATCHEDQNSKAPSFAAMQQKSTASVIFSLSNGKMRTQAQSLSITQQIDIATYISGGKAPYEPSVSDYCKDKRIVLDRMFSGKRGVDHDNTAAVGPDLSNLDSENIGSLSLKWAFELPGSSAARSQTVISGDSLFVAATSGEIFALDRKTACIKWHYHSEVPVRTSLTMHTLANKPNNKSSNVQPNTMLLFGDSDNFVNALNALTGTLLWRKDVGVQEHSILTGAVVADRYTVETTQTTELQAADFLIVPVSSYEMVLAADDGHECCKAHGAVHRLNAENGDIEWTAHMTAEATPRKKNKLGTQLWGPSGAPVWSTPTIDKDRGLVYIGTGQNASGPATETSDAIIALDLSNGKTQWQFQAMAGDVYNAACSQFPKGYSCPARPGPDFDFGASVIVTQNSEQRPLLIAGQKSGDIFALDPDNQGEVLWRTRIGAGSALGGIHWGMAVANGTLFAAVNDPPFQGYLGKPGLYAVNIDNGELLWNFELDRGCETTMRAYFERDRVYPECSFYFAMSAAVSIANDVVFAPALDGKVRAFDINRGKLLWQFDSNREFTTVSGSTAHGGSMDNVAVQFAGDMVYMQSGYSSFGLLPGNVLLGFEVTP